MNLFDNPKWKASLLEAERESLTPDSTPEELLKERDWLERKLEESKSENVLWGKVFVWVVTGLFILGLLQTIFRKV